MVQFPFKDVSSPLVASPHVCDGKDGLALHFLVQGLKRQHAPGASRHASESAVGARGVAA